MNAANNNKSTGSFDADVDGSILGLPLSEPERRAAARLLRIQSFGERVAMQGARGQAQFAPTPEARRFLRRQARQEAFHAWLFERAARALWPDKDRAIVVEIPPALLRVRHRLLDAIGRRSFSEAVVIQHVALEALGHAVLDCLDRELALMSNPFGRLRRVVLAQEDAHCEFGERWLATLREDTDVRRLEEEMTAEVDDMLQAIAPLLTILGGEPEQLIGEMRQRAFGRNAAVAS
ncbi:MAG: hypothetical protein ACR2QV_02620 [Gammaproteobacteria bacterium]